MKRITTITKAFHTYTVPDECPTDPDKALYYINDHAIYAHFADYDHDSEKVCFIDKLTDHGIIPIYEED